MKMPKQSVDDKLLVDVMEYAFVEWLIRRGVYHAFRSNCEFDKNHEKSFRSMLRRRIQNSLHPSHSVVGDIIAMSFVFSRTPEGVGFWFDQSFAWRRFCSAFQNNFK